MTVSCLRDQMRNKPSGVVLQHAKTLPKAQFTHDIEGQPAEHLTHIDCLLLLNTDPVDLICENFDIPEDQILHAPQSVIGEGGRENSTLSGMLNLVDGIVGVTDALHSRERRVEVGLLQRARQR